MSGNVSSYRTKKDAALHPFLFLVVFSFVISCSGAAEIRGGGVEIIRDVPFYPQEAYQCGPSSLAGVMNYLGADATPEEIAEEIYSKSAGGTLDMDMVLYAEKKGLRASLYEGSFEDIRDKVMSQQPLIVMVDYGFWVYQQNHFMVVTGFDKNGVIVNSGREQHKFLPINNFLRSWERTKFRTLLILPQ
ncbi:MAG: peptidase C39 family protein [Nitrospiraceae bacterium]|nr:MAG: peptidase C39 family protein [Nitrospiraceae bacterium]